MKKILSLFLAFTIMLSLCACQGNFGSVNLNESIEIPENGIIKESIIIIGILKSLLEVVLLLEFLFFVIFFVCFIQIPPLFFYL